jgi:hypothetical protein
MPKTVGFSISGLLGTLADCSCMRLFVTIVLLLDLVHAICCRAGFLFSQQIIFRSLNEVKK